MTSKKHLLTLISGALASMTLNVQAAEPETSSDDFLSPNPSSSYKGNNYRFPLGYSKLVKTDGSGSDTEDNTEESEDDEAISGGGSSNAFITPPAEQPVSSFPAGSNAGRLTFLESSETNYATADHSGYPYTFLTDTNVYAGNYDTVSFNFNVFPDDHLDFTLDDFSTFRIYGGEHRTNITNSYLYYTEMLIENVDGGPLYNQNGQLVSQTGLIKFSTPNNGGSNDYSDLKTTLPPGNYKISNYSERHSLTSSGYNKYLGYVKEITSSAPLSMPKTNVAIDGFNEVTTGTAATTSPSINNRTLNYEFLVDGVIDENYFVLQDNILYDGSQYTSSLDITVLNGGKLRVDINDVPYNSVRNKVHLVLESLDNEFIYDRYGKKAYMTKSLPLFPQKDATGGTSPYNHYETNIEIMAGKYRLTAKAWEEESLDYNDMYIKEVSVTPDTSLEFPAGQNRIAIVDVNNYNVRDGVNSYFRDTNTNKELTYPNFNLYVEGYKYNKAMNNGQLNGNALNETITFHILEESTIEIQSTWDLNGDKTYRDNFKYVIKNTSGEVVEQLDINYVSGTFTSFTSQKLPAGVYTINIIDTVGNLPSQYWVKYIKAFQ